MNKEIFEENLRLEAKNKLLGVQKRILVALAFPLVFGMICILAAANKLHLTPISAFLYYLLFVAGAVPMTVISMKYEDKRMSEYLRKCEIYNETPRANMRLKAESGLSFGVDKKIVTVIFSVGMCISFVILSVFRSNPGAALLAFTFIFAAEAGIILVLRHRNRKLKKDARLDEGEHHV